MIAFRKGKSLPSRITMPKSVITQSDRKINANYSIFLPTKVFQYTPKVAISLEVKWLKITSFLLMMTSVISLILFFLLSELTFAAETPSSEVVGIRYAIIFISLANFLIILKSSRTTLSVKKSYREASRRKSIFTDGPTRTQLIIELLIAAPFIPPHYFSSYTFPQISTTATLSLDDLIIFPAVFRIYFLLKFLYEISPYNTTRSYFYLKLFSIESPLRFNLKSYIRSRPFSSLAFLGGLSLVVLGAALRVFEKSLPGSAYHSIWDQFYIISVSQLTLGYGDTTAKTHIGRTICVFAAIYGLFIISYLILSVNRATEMSSTEVALYQNALYKYNIKKQLEPTAALLIQRWWRLWLKRKLSSVRLKELIAFSSQLKKFSSKRVGMVESKSERFEDRLKSFSLKTDGKFKPLLKELARLTEYEKSGIGYVKEEFDLNRKLVSLSRTLQGKLEFARNGVRRNTVVEKKPHMKILQDRAFKRMLTKTNLSPGYSDHSDNGISSRKASTKVLDI